MGPQGDTGPAGPQGPAGADGATGAAGPALGGIVIVTATGASNAAAVSTASVSASCAAGHVMLGGGGRVTTNDAVDLVQLIATYPSADDTWTVTGSASIHNNKTWSVQAYVVCSA
jgi:hypothetical protein